MASLARPWLASALLGAGCAEFELETIAPELIAAEFVEPEPGERPSLVELRFSESLGPIADVDPEHFRMSIALVIDDGQGGELTVYYDLSHGFSEGLPGQDGRLPDLGGPWPRHAFTIVAALEHGEAADELILQLSYPLDLAICEALDQAATLGIPAGIFVHYAEADYPRITDEAGNALADLAAHWLEVNGVTAVAGAYVWLDPTLAIPCR